MKITINVFLLKAGKESREALAADVHLRPIRFQLGDTECNFYHEENYSHPKWLSLFEGVNEIAGLGLSGRSLKALLVMRVRERVFCFTFGHARHLIASFNIERYFGLRTALSLTDPLLIKSVEKFSIDRTPLRSKSQSSKHLAISDFDFKFDSEILKSLTGAVEERREGQDDQDDAEYVSGSDSLALHSDVKLNEFPEISARLLAAYEDDGCREKYPWIDHIVPVRDETLLTQLDGILVGEINAANFSNVRATPPVMLGNDIFGFGYMRHNRRSRHGPVIYFDLDLRQAIFAKELVGIVTKSKLDSEKIYLYDGESQRRDNWSLYECLEAEVEFEGYAYLLSEGDWYQIDRGYTQEINEYFNRASRSDLVFPPYGNDNEGAYLRRIADGDSFHLLDQKLVRLSAASSPFEFCDLLTSGGDIIHVKKYSSSSVLSHLFAQAYVSAEALINDPDVIDQVNARLAESGNHRFLFDRAMHPRNKVVFAIMQRNESLHMPFFSKVNFRQFSQRLQAMGYRVELCKISPE